MVLAKVGGREPTPILLTKLLRRILPNPLQKPRQVPYRRSHVPYRGSLRYRRSQLECPAFPHVPLGR